VLDLHSRRLVGWSLAGHARAELAGDALEAAVATRGGTVAGVVFHTDPLNLGNTPQRPSPSCATTTV
jgi:transposase InsO family protein